MRRLNKVANQIKTEKSNASAELLAAHSKAKDLYNPCGAQSEEYAEAAKLNNELSQKEGLPNLMVAI